MSAQSWLGGLGALGATEQGRGWEEGVLSTALPVSSLWKYCQSLRVEGEVNTNKAAVN